MFCMNCGLELPEDAKFCRKCAAPLTSCPECGEDIPKRAKYCWKCGKSLATVSVSSGLKEPEEPGSLLDEPENDPENVLPAKSDNASIFARMSSAKSAEAAHQNGAPSPFKQSAGAKHESSASAYSPAGMPSAFKPASEKKKKDIEKDDQPAPSPYNRFADAASPFKPLGSAKTESAPSRPAASRGTASAGGSRPAAPRGAAAVSGSRPAAPRGAAAVAGSRPSSAFRPAAQDEAKETPAEKEAPAASRAAASSSPFKPLGSTKTETRSTRSAAAPRGAAAVAGTRPAAPRGAAAVAGTRPAASASAFRPAARPAAKEEPEAEKEAPAAAPAVSAAPASPSSPFKPLSSAKPAAARAAASTASRPASGAVSAFKPAPKAEEVKEPEIEEEAPVAAQPSAPVTFVPSGLFKPLEPEKTEAPAPRSDAALRAAASSAPASYSAFKPLGSTESEEAMSPSAPQTPSPFASAISSSPFASGSAFSPLTSSEPDLEVPKKSFGFTAYRPGMSTSDDKSGDKKPVNPTAMFHMNSNSGAMSSLGESESSSLGADDYLGAPNAGSLMSDGFEDSDEKLPQRTDDSHPRFFRRSAPAAAPETEAAPAPAPERAPESNPLMPKAEPARLRTFTSSGPSPFKPASGAETDDDKPYVREPGASPFRPLNI